MSNKKARLGLAMLLGMIALMLFKLLSVFFVELGSTETIVVFVLFVIVAGAFLAIPGVDPYG